MIDAIISGKLVGRPVSRVASNGNGYVTAKVRAATDSGESVYVNVIAFAATAVASLLALSDGDPLAISAELSLRTWTDKDGAVKPSLSAKAHQVISPYNVQRRRKAVQAAEEQTSFLDDPVPDFMAVRS
jgi:single-stranded DNA-binding protein